MFVVYIDVKCTGSSHDCLEIGLGIRRAEPALLICLQNLTLISVQIHLFIIFTHPPLPYTSPFFPLPQAHDSMLNAQIPMPSSPCLPRETARRAPCRGQEFHWGSMLNACPVKQPKGLPVVDRGFTGAPCPLPHAPCLLPQFPNSPIPQFLNSSIPQFLNPSIPQFPNSSITQFLNSPIPQFLNPSIPQFPNPCSHPPFSIDKRSATYIYQYPIWNKK